MLLGLNGCIPEKIFCHNYTVVLDAYHNCFFNNQGFARVNGFRLFRCICWYSWRACKAKRNNISWMWRWIWIWRLRPPSIISLVSQCDKSRRTNHWLASACWKDFALHLRVSRLRMRTNQVHLSQDALNLMWVLMSLNFLLDCFDADLYYWTMTHILQVHRMQSCTPTPSFVPIFSSLWQML